MSSQPQWPPWFYQPLSQYELPVSHRTVTIHATVITFQVLAWIAVGFRIYCRCIVARAFGRDDFLVLVSLCTTTINTAVTALATKYGMGQHYGVVLNNNNMLIYWYRVYFATVLLYFLSATLIKCAILLQYLRLLQKPEHRMPRLVCKGLIGFVSIWGAIFFLVQLFSCKPVSDAWNTGNANCYAFMSYDLNEYLAGIVTHAVTNMILDYTILCLPIVFRRHLEIEGRGRSALIALFTFGGCVATISAIRLIFIVAYKGGLHPSEDATWYAPAIMIPSAVEIQAAVICASVPIFWPIVSKVLRIDQIIVTREVTLHSESRSGASGLRGWKRHSESSETELRDLTAAESGNHSAPEVNQYPIDGKDGYITSAQVTSETILDPDFGNSAHARSPSYSHRKNSTFSIAEKQ